MTQTAKYILKAHDLYYTRILEIKKRVTLLKKKLPKNKFIKHDLVKFAKRLREADKTTIPDDPSHQDYRLSGELRKFKRYKRGLQRYRLFFCYSTNPPIIVYLYLNDDKTLHEEGSKTDPYEIFTKFVHQKKVSSNPSDSLVKEFIKNYS